MQHSNDRKRIAASLGFAVALGLPAALSGQSAQAGISFFDATTGSTANLGPGTVTTSAYPAGDQVTIGPTNNPGPFYGVLPATFSVAAGSDLLTFSAAGNSGGFANTTNMDSVTKLPLYAISSPNVLETINLTGLQPTGPLEIDFQQGVTGFGFNAEDFGAFFESFTVTAYNGANILGVPFTTPVIDSTGDSPGKSAFLGAQTTNGDVITKLIISNAALTPDPMSGQLVDSGFGNDFVFGPVTVIGSSTPVPEASTFVSGGFGLLLFGGLFVWGKRKAAKAAA